MIEKLEFFQAVKISGLDIGEVVVAGLIKLGHLPLPDANKLTKYQVTIRDGSPNLPGFVDNTVSYPYIVVKGQ